MAREKRQKQNSEFRLFLVENCMGLPVRFSFFPWKVVRELKENVLGVHRKSESVASKYIWNSKLAFWEVE